MEKIWRAGSRVWMPLLLVLVGGGVLGGAPESDKRMLWTTLPGPTPQYSMAGLIEATRPAVVAIHTVYQQQRPRLSAEPLPGPFPYQPWHLFPDVPREERAEGIGSGFIIREDGYVVSNFHVIEGAGEVRVGVEGLGATFPARVVGSDPRSDIALLKIDPPRALRVLPLGNSDELPVGAWVVAIGNPFGLAHVATKGIVSGKGRTLGDLSRVRAGYFDFIQTDAAIDLGNSGGPLLNLRGEVVGINTAINSRARGIGFAVPIELAKAVLPHLFDHGRVIRSYLGIAVDEVQWELAVSLKLEGPRGVVVSEVKAGGPSEKAGILRGDVILKFGGHPVSGSGDMSWRAGTAAAGRAVEVELWRAGRAVTVRVTPTVRASEKSASAKPAPRVFVKEKPTLGLKVVDLEPNAAASCGLPEGTAGVVVVAAEGDAAIYGIRVGDVIVEVNDEAIRVRADFERALGKVELDKMIRFYILRQKSALYVALPKRWATEE